MMKKYLNNQLKALNVNKMGYSNKGSSMKCLVFIRGMYKKIEKNCLCLREMMDFMICYRKFN